MSQILLNSQPHQFDVRDLPCLIHGAAGAGASLFTCHMMVQLYNLGYSLIFLSGYHMAREEFLNQSQAVAESVVLESHYDIATISAKRVIFVTRENSHQVEELISVLPDIDNRIMLIKNFELYDPRVITSALTKPQLVLSGNLDKSPAIQQISRIKFSTTIAFSPSHTPAIHIGSNLPQYTGFLHSASVQGPISVTS